MPLTLPAFIARWTASGAAERANKDLFLSELCDVLDVPRPVPATGHPDRDTYVFEKDAILPHEGGTTTFDAPTRTPTAYLPPPNACSHAPYTRGARTLRRARAARAWGWHPVGSRRQGGRLTGGTLLLRMHAAHAEESA